MHRTRFVLFSNRSVVVPTAEHETRSHLAIVLDNVGGVAGLLTLTDVLQRLLPVAGAIAWHPTARTQRALS